MNKNTSTIALYLLATICVFFVGCPYIPSAPGKSYQLSHYTKGVRIEELFDGGFFIVGNGIVQNTPVGDDLPLMLARIAPDYSIEWWCIKEELFSIRYVTNNPGGRAAFSNDDNIAAIGLDIGPYDHSSSRKVRIAGTNNTCENTWSIDFDDSVSRNPGSIVSVDNDYVAAISEDSEPYPSKTLLLMKLSSDGEELWTRQHLHNGLHFRVADLRYLSNEGFAATGNAYLDGGMQYAYLFLADLDGNEVLFNVYDETESGQDICAIGEMPDGGYVIGGFTWGFPTSRQHPLLIRVDENGDLLWFQDNILPLQSNQYAEVYGMTVDDEGYIVFVGERVGKDYVGDFFPNFDREGYMIRCDPEGNLVWYKGFGELAYTYGVTHTMQGTYMAIGTTDSGDLLLIEVDKQGNVVN